MSVVAMDTALARPMPQSPEAERAVLGAILLNATVIDRVCNVLVPEDFYRDAHRVIYTTLLEIDNDGAEPDLLVAKERLTARGQLDAVGGVAYISSLVDGIPDIGNVERYAQIVKRKAQLRALVSIGNAVVQRALSAEDAPEEIASDITEKLQLVRPSDAMSSVIPLETLEQRLLQLYQQGGMESGASTVWPTVNELYSVPRRAWTLVTGMPGSGKSGWLDHLVLGLAAQHQQQVVMFSAENYPPELHVTTLLEKLVRAPFNDGPTARMSIETMRRGLAFIEQRFRFINPASEGMTLDRLLAVASALAEQKRVDVLTIDPWNELQHEYAAHLKETDYIRACLAKLRRWAWRHDAHVFLVAHPTKLVKDKAGKYPVPTAYDVSGSAHWRNQADFCVTVYRDVTEGDSDPDVQIHVQKVRRRHWGRLGMAMLRYDRVTGEYLDPQVRRTYREWAND